MARHSSLLILLLVATVGTVRGALNSVWRWECVQGYCQKFPVTPDTEESALSLAACHMFCSEDAGLWPKPTGTVSVGNFLLRIDPTTIEVVGGRADSPIAGLVSAAFDIFKDNVGQPTNRKLAVAPAKTLVVTLVMEDQDTNRLALDTDESYSLYISETSDGKVNATVLSATYFGGRHGLETLGQLTIFDDLRNEVRIPRDVHIEDRPAYPYRGILLDTARNYVSVDAIKRTINGMGASKLNSFHWHITDSHSFPYVSQSRPDFSKYGAYSPSKVYTAEDIADVIQFATERGVRVIPEFDAPAHVGEGWQNTDMVTCFNAKPWQDFCVEPPCGQLDPTKADLYNVLEDIYKDMLTQFQPDIFHMGGDEVHFGCWNSTQNIVDWMAAQGWGRSEADFVKLWNYFQKEALARVYKQAGREIPVVMWTSTLTQKEYFRSSLPKEQYIIQIWTKGTDPQVADLLQNGYRVIISNHDALYLDCGFGGWVQDGKNWCSPYVGWQKVYQNKPATIAGDKKGQVLGSEATLWAEQSDSSTVDGRLWPRAAAMAEVFWSEPTTDWRAAEQRMLVQRERLVARGIAADALEPEWCRQNEENCPINGKWNRGPEEEADDPDDSGPGGATAKTYNFFGVALIVGLNKLYF